MADAKKKKKRSKEEIARDFVLPERQSKIATILRNDSEAYCICRSSDSSRFMIACDGCDIWYHGDCINVTEKEAKHIKHYYCQRCKEEDPSLQTVFRAVPGPVPGVTAEDRKSKKLDIRKEKSRERARERDKGRDKEKARDRAAKSKDRCGECEACTAPNCGRCNSCLSRQSGKKHRCENRICQVVQAKKDKAMVSRPKRRRRSPSPAEVFINPELEGIRHCRGLECRMTARPQSKYCSDVCGLNMAKYRIFNILPQRIQEWNLSSCMAEEQNKRQLDSIRAKQATVRATLLELDKRHRELDLLVVRAKHCTLDPRALDNNDQEDESSMYCITCGHEIHSRTAIRHLEKCFNKYESQASFGSTFKTRLDSSGNSIFCDFYNHASNTYCKRLKVLCPEHCKDAKVSDADVCGCPLVRNTFELTGDYCRAPKKSCFKHYVWEKIRRAEIDLERLRQWLKMDDLNDQEQKVRTAMASRAGVLGLLLHSTYNHEVMERLCRQATRKQ